LIDTVIPARNAAARRRLRVAPLPPDGHREQGRQYTASRIGTISCAPWIGLGLLKVQSSFMQFVRSSRLIPTLREAALARHLVDHGTERLEPVRVADVVLQNRS
jgi:hypothetical protein